MKARGEFALALLLDLVGAGGALLVSTRTWQSVTLDRPGLLPLHLDVSGRTVDGAGTALALAALAAVVAVLATRGIPRRVIGALVVPVGAGLVWRAVTHRDAVSAARARSLLQSHQHGAVLGDVPPHVVIHAAWPWLAAVAGLLVALAGLLVAVRGGRWQGMSRRYQAPSGLPADATSADGSGDLALWKALDRGDDPTA